MGAHYIRRSPTDGTGSPGVTPHERLFRTKITPGE